MNEKKLGIRTALTGVIGYLIVIIAYTLLDGGSSTVRGILIGSIGAVVIFIIGALDHLYVRKKYPKIVKVIAAEESDERGQLIRGKTSTYTLILIAFLAIGLFIYSVYKDYRIIAEIIGISYVLAVVFNIGVNSYLNKNN